MPLKSICVLLAAMGPAVLAPAQPPAERDAAVRPLPQAHAHNDYRHERPLEDALARGFCSIEADVFLHEEQLLVGHERSELRPGRTLQALYLDPLLRRVQQNGGRVYRDGPPLTLLVDFKSQGQPTYVALRSLLSDYSQMCTSVDRGQRTQRAVDVIVSGNRPTAAIAAETSRRVMVDGRIDELTPELAVELVPLVSENWTGRFAWRGEGPFPAPEQARLRALVDQVHQQGRKLRFWATPDKPPMWEALIEAEVDVVGVDDLDALAKFLNERLPAQPGRD